MPLLMERIDSLSRYSPRHQRQSATCLMECLSEDAYPLDAPETPIKRGSNSIGMAEYLSCGSLNQQHLLPTVWYYNRTLSWVTKPVPVPNQVRS